MHRRPACDKGCVLYDSHQESLYRDVFLNHVVWNVYCLSDQQFF